jgi:hypothetical protein
MTQREIGTLPANLLAIYCLCLEPHPHRESGFPSTEHWAAPARADSDGDFSVRLRKKE